MQGQGLGTSDEAALLSAADWVKRSRAKESETVKNQEIQNKDSLVKENYNSSNLKGLKVKHSASAFDSLNAVNDTNDISEGVILTLADTSILTKDGRGRVTAGRRGEEEEADVLENILLKESDLRAERDRKVRRMKQPLYGGFDDDEFEDQDSIAVSMVGVSRARKILPHYDLDRQVRKQEILIGTLDACGGMSAVLLCVCV